MENRYSDKLQLLQPEELDRRLNRVKAALTASGLDSALITDNANVFYLTGRVFCGYLYISVNDSVPAYFIRRPNHLQDERAFGIRKVEEIPALIEAASTITPPSKMGLELDLSAYSAIERVRKAFGEAALGNACPALRQARSVKTEVEQEQMRMSGRKQTLVYEKIPHLYQEGMSDIEFQIEIERALRLEGCLGQFRTSGPDMDIYMGNVLTGDNADTPSPYDFAMGGSGLNPSLPAGANGSLIRPGKPVMVDVNGNFTGYMTDMTRIYCCGEPAEQAVHANNVSIEICDKLAQAGLPGTPARDLYEMALSIARDAGLEEYFMGHRYHAGFVGHGVGIDINELPVIAPRSRDILEAGNAIALEPKFVIPGIGAVGVENTYIVQSSGPMERITNAPQQITNLI